MDKLRLPQRSNNITLLNITPVQTEEAVPCNHTPPGGTVVASVCVDVP